MNREDISMTLRSFMEIQKSQCDIAGKPFDVDAAINAAEPVIESLLYTISSGGKLEGNEESGGIPADLVDAIQRAELVLIEIDNGNYDTDDAYTNLLDIVDIAANAGVDLSTTANPNTNPVAVPTTTVDDLMKKLGNP